MADRSEPRALDNYYPELVQGSDDVSNAPVLDEELAVSVEAIDHHPGSWPLLHLTKKPTLTPVPRPHNAASLARSAFADANLPVVNVHVKRKKLELRGH